MKWNRWLTLAFLAVCSVVSSPLRGNDRLAVAIMDFTAPVERYDARVAGDAALVQAHLYDNEFLFVERSGLDAARTELARAYLGQTVSALQVGRLVKADLVVLSRFNAPEDQNWELRVEILDPDRADLLSSRTQQLQIASDRPLVLDEQELTRIGQTIREALIEARQQHARSRRPTAVAPLFFENQASSGRRLDFLEEDLTKALTDAAARTRDIRVLHFPRAAEATPEAELVLSGLVNADPHAPRTLADAYVWGAFQEIDWRGKPFEDVTVQITLHVWTGDGEPVNLEERVLVKNLPRALPALAKRTLSACRRGQKEYRQEQAQQIARSLLERSQQIQADDRGGEEDATSDWLARWRQLCRLLEVAYFFDPHNATVHRELILERYRDDIAQNYMVLFTDADRDQAARDAWAQHVERFGLDGDWPSYNRTRHGGLLYDGRGRTPDNTVAAECLGGYDSWLWSLKGRIDYGPTDQRNEREARYGAACAEFVRRIERVFASPHDRPDWVARVFFETDRNLLDPALRARAFEALLPSLALGVHERTVDRVRATCLAAFEAVGRRAKLEAHVAAIPPLAPKSPPAPDDSFEAVVAPKAGLVAPLALMPPARTPAMRILSFDKNLYLWRINDLRETDNCLWISLTGQRMIRDDLPATDEVWLYKHGTDQMTSARHFTGEHPTATSFVVADRAMWITMEGGGVWRLVAEDPRVTRLGLRDGLTTLNLFDGARLGNQLFFGGGEENGQGQLLRYDLESKQWSAEDLAQCFPRAGNGIAAPRIDLVAAAAAHVLVAGDHHGVQPFTATLTPASRTWRDLGPSLIAHVREAPGSTVNSRDIPWDRFRAKAVVGDEHAFWIGTPAGVTRYEPTRETCRTWFTLPAQADQTPANSSPSHVPSLFGEPTAIALDGNRLWVATQALRSRWSSGDPHNVIGTYLFVLDTKSGRWLSHTTIPHQGSVTCIEARRGKVWLGLTHAKDNVNLLELDQAALTP